MEATVSLYDLFFDCRFCHIPFVTSWLQRAAHSQGVRIKLYFLKGGVSIKEFVNIFRNYHMEGLGGSVG